MKYNGIEHFDQFEDEVVFWVDITDTPQAIQDKAKTIDGENYSADCFGMCVCYDRENKSFDVVTDTDQNTGDSNNLYYVDNLGGKNWFQADMPPTFVHEVFAACNCTIMEIEDLTRESKRSITEQLKQVQKQNQNEEDRGNVPKKSAINRERETR